MDTPSDDGLTKIRQRIATYPTELRYRFELGDLLCKRREYDAAIPELQRAMSNPFVRLQAMAFLVEAFDAEGMVDLAASMRAQLSKESGEEGDSGSAPDPVPT